MKNHNTAAETIHKMPTQIADEARLSVYPGPDNGSELTEMSSNLISSLWVSCEHQLLYHAVKG